MFRKHKRDGDPVLTTVGIGAKITAYVHKMKAIVTQQVK